MAIYHRSQESDATAAHRTADDRDVERRVLPLGGQIETVERGWRLRLPVRAEEVSVSKRTIVVEEVIVRTKPLADVARVRETVRREEPRVDSDLPVDDDLLHRDVTQPLDSAIGPDRTPRFQTRERRAPRLDD